jgi:hypothetical protein
MLARRRVPTRSSKAMMVLLSKTYRGWTGWWVLPTTSEEAFESDEQQNGEETAAGKESTPIAATVAVVSVRTKVRATKTVGIPDGAKDDAQDDGDCDEDENG